MVQLHQSLQWVPVKSRLGEQLPIIPGMTAEVDVLTGSKTILSYLLKPVLKVKDNALKER